MTDLTQANVERFNAIAGSWNENPAHTERARAIAEAIRQTVPLNSAVRAMELGAGTGLVTALLAPELGPVLAVDSASGMLAVLEENAAKLGLSNVQALRADLSKDIPAGPFDLIFSSMTMHHIEDVAGVLRELTDRLADGGHLALADLEKEDGRFHATTEGIAHFGFEPAQFAQWLTAADLVDVRVERVHVVEKPGADGQARRYPVFLATARKPAQLNASR